MSKKPRNRNQNKVVQPPPVESTTSPEWDKAITLPTLSDLQVMCNDYPKDWFRDTLEISFADRNEQKKYEDQVSDLFFHGGQSQLVQGAQLLTPRKPLEPFVV